LNKPDAKANRDADAYAQSVTVERDTEHDAQCESDADAL